MDLIDVNIGRLPEVEIKGHYGVFTELRVDKSTIPEGVNCYELRHGDDDSYPATLEENVRVDYFGAVLMTDKMELGNDGYVALTFDDFGYTGEELSMPEYRANYGEEPEMFSATAELVEFMDTNDMLFHLSEKEAGVLLNYLSGHDFILGHKDGKLFRGDLDYAQNTTRWLENTIDDAVDFVCQCNDDLIKTAQAELENQENFIDFVNKKSRLDSLWEDERVLDAMFDRTKYGKEIEKLAETLVEEFLTGMRAKGGVGEAVKKLTEAIGSTTDMLQEKNVEQMQRSGKVR